MTVCRADDKTTCETLAGELSRKQMALKGEISSLDVIKYHNGSIIPFGTIKLKSKK